MDFIKFVLDMLSRSNKSIPSVQPPPITQVELPPEVITTMIEPIAFSIQPQSNNALSGTDFGKILSMKSSVNEREQLILNECLSGNIPDFMRQPVPITISDDHNTITYYVSPDVLCIGNNNDFLRVSASGYTYKKIADAFNACFLTNKMSRQVWENSNVKLTPITWPGPFTEIMGAPSTIIWHNTAIEKQRNNQMFKLLSGHKKDMIVSKDLILLPNNICITGWYYPNGKAIQPKASRVHDSRWIDYAQAFRLVHKNCVVNGNAANILDVINDPNLCYLISDEGPFDISSMYDKNPFVR